MTTRTNPQTTTDRLRALITWKAEVAKHPDWPGQPDVLARLDAQIAAASKELTLARAVGGAQDDATLLPAPDREREYRLFLDSKRATVQASGFAVTPDAINPKLFPFQRDITRWALNLGKAALFEAVGLGKTFQQLEWAHHVHQETRLPALILSPLGVADQTVQEGKKLGIDVKRVYEQGEVGSAPLVITNYDRVHLFDVSRFGGVVLDESSLLKHYSKTFFLMVDLFRNTPYKLCCTATPAPNEYVEFGNHSMFLDVMHFKDMLARWFVGEGDIARTARLKHHARADFWRWLTSWAVCISKPRDLGEQYDMPGYDLPPLHLHEHRLSANQAAINRAWSEGKLLPDSAPSATKFMRVKRERLPEFVAKNVEIVKDISASEQILLWVDTDFEADALLEVFPEALEVRGSQTTKKKEDGLRAFGEGSARILITKPEIAGFGLNYQNCHHMILPVSFSFEKTWQALGRSHRYGQTQDVHAHLIYAETEGSVLQLLNQKRADYDAMQREMSAAMREHGLFRDQGRAGFSSANGTKPIVIPTWLRSHRPVSRLTYGSIQ